MSSFIHYKNAFVAIGNNEMRDVLLGKLVSCGYEIPTIIYPTAYVSRLAKIAQGVLVELHARASVRKYQKLNLVKRNYLFGCKKI